MNTQPRQIQLLEPHEVYTYLHSRQEGLSPGEVRERLQHVGPNSFVVADRSRWLKSLLRQFTNFFALLLLISALLCGIAHRINPGENMDILGWAILGVALLNALFSFFQEFRAERAMAALKAFLPQMVEVRRDNTIVEVLATEVVPGDILLLSEGNKISADARLIRSESLQVNNAPLTGEANPSRLIAGPVAARLEESENIAFAGASVLRGNGEAVVFATGLRTEFGKLAHLSQTIRRTDSPLERETSRMVKILTIIASCMGVSFFLYGMFIGRPLWVNLVFMMGIIVANVPEGLLPTFTLSLVMGSLRMARKNVLVKSLNAVEALGAVHVICSDKTGTITQNRLSIAEIVDPLAGKPLPQAEHALLLTCALAASEVRVAGDNYLGDALDREIAQAFGGRDEVVAFQQTISRSFSFDLEKKRSAGIYAESGQHVFAVKGAYEALRPLLARVAASTDPAGTATDVRVVDQATLARVEEVVAAAAAQGHRVIAVASRVVTEQEVEAVTRGTEEGTLQEQLERELVLNGLLILEDPVRPEVQPAVAKCHGAGIEVMLITGDHPRTAWAVARKCGIVTGEAEGQILTGDILAGLTIQGLQEEITRGVRVFARTTPDQKMKIVAALKAMEKVVAMTGDGVNDAPALKAADVGIAMGLQGTDVARESAQIILLDDNFASIVDGVEEGRTVYENIRKFTSYVLASNVPEMLPYLLFILFPIPLALGVIHILSIDLGTDIVPSMGLGQEPPEKDVMDKPPRSENTTPALAGAAAAQLPVYRSAGGGMVPVPVFFGAGWRRLELRHGTGCNEIPCTAPPPGSPWRVSCSCRSATSSVGVRRAVRGWTGGCLPTRLIMIGIAIQVVFSWAVLYWPPVQKVMGTGPVSLQVYGLAWLRDRPRLRRRLPAQKNCRAPAPQPFVLTDRTA